MDRAAAINELITFSRGLSGVTEDVKWGRELVFSVGDKMFCVFSEKQGELARVSFKVPDERFLEYTDREQFIPAPYLARAKWVTIINFAGLDPAEIRDAIKTSWQLVLSKLSKTRQRAILGDS